MFGNSLVSSRGFRCFQVGPSEFKCVHMCPSAPKPSVQFKCALSLWLLGGAYFVWLVVWNQSQFGAGLDIDFTAQGKSSVLDVVFPKWCLHRGVLVVLGPLAGIAFRSQIESGANVFLQT